MRYRFGQYELDLDMQALTRAGEPVALWPKVFDLLRYLVEHPGRLVSKQELLDEVWADAHVGDGSLSWTISHARRALGQTGQQKQPIETVHKRGYRFVAEVEVVQASQLGTAVAPVFEVARHPFVGRERVIESLQARLREARDERRGSLTLLVGPLGIGKTRCMDEAAALAAHAGFDVWPSRCVEGTLAPIFWPWTLVLREAVRARPALARRVSAPDASFEWLESVSELLADAANERPILIAFDDLQWADMATIELLAFIAPELRRSPIVVIATLRTDDEGQPSALAPPLKRLARNAQRIDIEPLTTADVARYLSIMLSADALRPELPDAMHRATAGNPLFLEHTVRGLLSRPKGESIEPAQIARDTFGAALERLEAGTRELLLTASVLGERFGLSELQALVAVEPEDLLARLEPALRRGVLITEGPSTLRFSHALMRLVAYDSLSSSTRAALHRDAARVLEASGGERSAEIAHHYHQALSLGDYARVTAAAARAARVAARMHAFADASRFSAWAVEAQELESHVPPRARAELLLFHAQMQASGGADAAARETIASVAALAREHGLYDLLVQAARTLRPFPLMGSLEDPYLRTLLEEALAHAPEGANDMRVSALSQLAWMPPYSLDVEQSKAMSAEALELARQLGDETLLLRALTARLHALSGPDDCDTLLAASAEMMTLDRTPTAQVVAAALGARHAAHLHRGDIAAATVALAELGRLAQAHRWPAVIWIHDRLSVQAQISRGELADASIALDALRAYVDRFRVPFGAEMQPVLDGLWTLEKRGAQALKESADLNLLRAGLSIAPIGLRPTIARLLLELGDRSAAQAVFDALAANDFASIPRDIGYLGALASLGALAILLDDRARAQRLYDVLARYPQHNTLNLLSLHEGSVSHFLGLLAAYLGMEPEAERHFEDALTMNERIGQRPQLARTCYEYARWLTARGQDTRARELLARSRSLAESLGMDALLARLSAR